MNGLNFLILKEIWRCVWTAFGSPKFKYHLSKNLFSCLKLYLRSAYQTFEAVSHGACFDSLISHIKLAYSQPMHLSHEVIMCLQITRAREDFNGDSAVKSLCWHQILNLPNEVKWIRLVTPEKNTGCTDSALMTSQLRNKFQASQAVYVADDIMTPHF